jgi:uncharacterized repeat protein (TIGR03803 family)
VKITALCKFKSIAIDNRVTLSSLASTLSLVLLLTLLAVPAAHAQTFSVIHTFGSGEGSYPYSRITIKSGNLYGTTSGGGQYRPGSVYQISRVGSNWITTPLILFWLNGYGPNGGANFGPDGYLYSTTRLGALTTWEPSSISCLSNRCAAQPSAFGRKT